MHTFYHSNKIFTSVYYQLYAKHTLTPSSTNPDNPYVGRINIRDLGPPRSVAIVKKCILTLEKIDVSNNATVFLKAGDSNPVTDDGLRILRAAGNPGRSADAPIAIVLSRETQNATQTKRNLWSSKTSIASYSTLKPIG